MAPEPTGRPRCHRAHLPAAKSLIILQTPGTISFMALESSTFCASGTVRYWSVSHADGVDALVGAGQQRAVAGLAAGAEDHVGALVDHRLRGGLAPFGIGEGLVEAHIVVIDQLTLMSGFTSLAPAL